MIRLMINTFELLIKKKINIVLGIMLSAFIIVFFSFEFGNEPNFKVGIVDKDNTYVSQEIINTINNLDGVDVTKVKEQNYKVDLMTQQIQMLVIINQGFEENLLCLKNQNIIIKSITESDVKATVELMINIKMEDLIIISKLSDNDINKFIEINQDYNDTPTQFSLNDTKEYRSTTDNSMGLVIMIILLSILIFIISIVRLKFKRKG